MILSSHLNETAHISDNGVFHKPPKFHGHRNESFYEFMFFSNIEEGSSGRFVKHRYVNEIYRMIYCE
jgi:hypothetical protein